MSTTEPTTTRRGRRNRTEQPPDQGTLVDPPVQPETPADPPADPPATIDPPPQSTALTLPERALAAMKLQVTVEELTALAASTATITAITNTDGRKQTHSAAMTLADKRLEITNAGKVAREDAVKFQKEVIVQAGNLVALIEPEEKRLLKLRDDWDSARELERKAKADADAKRMAAIHERIQVIRDTVAECAGHNALEIDRAIRELVGAPIDDTFAELKGLAEQVHANVLARLRNMHAERVKFEEQRAQHEAEAAKRKAELDAEIAKQREERALNTMRMARIREIGNLVVVATVGRSPDRKAGTRECIVATLEEVLAFPLNDFGALLDNAVASKAAAVEQIEHILKRHDDRIADAERAERQRIEDEQRRAENDAREAAERERQRAERQRLDDERDAAQAEHQRIAAENARQAEELQRQQAAIDAQRAEFERLQAHVDEKRERAAQEVREQMGLAQVEGATEPDYIQGTGGDSPQGVLRYASQHHEEFTPTPEQLIALVASEYCVSDDMAGKWLRQAFGVQL